MSTSLVKIADKSPTSPSNLPRLLPAEQTTRDAAAFIGRWRRAQTEERAPNVSYHEHLLQVTETVLPEAGKHLAQLEKLSAPASKVEIANHLAVLLKSFPNGGKDDGAQVFGRMLCEDVGAQEPTIGGLEAACRQLRRTCRFIPTIAEVLAALTEVEEQQRKCIDAIANLPEHRERLAARVQENRARSEEVEREWEDWKRKEREREDRKAPVATKHDDDSGSPF